MPELDLSLIIVNWNTRDCLRDCLASLPEACRDLSHEVLVVDNSSRDGSADMVARDFPEYRLIPGGGNLGFSRGNNLALPLATGRYVVLLNPDTVATPGAFAKLLAFAEDRPELAAVTPLLTDAQGNPTITYGYFPRPWFHWLGFLDPRCWLRLGGLGDRVVCVPGNADPSAVVDYIAGACFLMPRPALEKIGLLDERFFMYFEETDWCWRARQAGLEVWYCAEVAIAHLEGQAAAKASLFSIRQFQKSYRQFIAKNYSPQQVGHFRLAQFLEYGMKALLRSLALGNRERNENLAAGYRERARLQLKSEVEAQPPA